jgi:hypothetical protein
VDNQLVTLGPAPAHITPGGGARLSASIHAGIQASFAVLKIRGKVWRIRYRGEERLLQESPGTDHNGRPLPVTPKPTLDVIVVGSASAISKRYYISGFQEGGEGKPPDCFSINGISPDPASAAKQSPMCATCRHNVWGSSTTGDGRKSKACSDRKRIAVVPAADPANEGDGGPMLLDIPPASLKVLDKYASEIMRVGGADISEVITRVGFDPLKTLELTFTCIGWVDPRAYNIAMEHSKSDQVHRMLNEEVVEVTADADALAALGPRPSYVRLAPSQQLKQEVTASGSKEADEDEGDEGEEPVPEPEPAPAPTPAPKPVSVPPAAAVTTDAMRKTVKAMAAKAAVPTVVQGAPPSMEEEIARLLNNDE